jgi:predicted RNA-binding Zn-ribbon protein involved in translation (DUF1610 family)
VPPNDPKPVARLARRLDAMSPGASRETNRRASLVALMAMAVANAPDHIEFAGLRTTGTSSPCPGCGERLLRLEARADERAMEALVCAECEVVFCPEEGAGAQPSPLARALRAAL